MADKNVANNGLVLLSKGLQANESITRRGAPEEHCLQQLPPGNIMNQLRSRRLRKEFADMKKVDPMLMRFRSR